MESFRNGVGRCPNVPPLPALPRRRILHSESLPRWHHHTPQANHGPLSLQLPPSPHHVMVHGADTEVKSLWGCAGLWAARLRRAGLPEGQVTPQSSGVLRDGTLELVPRCHSFAPAQ